MCADLRPDQISACDAFLLGKIDRIEFCKNFGFASQEIPAEVGRLLSIATQSRDKETVAYALLLGFWFGFPENVAARIHDLIGQEWHQGHEDMISLLQDFKDPDSIPYLQTAIELKPALEYLEYDDYGAYYKKCLWALAAIGTRHALAVIEDCTKADDKVLAKEARCRLKRIADTQSEHR